MSELDEAVRWLRDFAAGVCHDPECSFCQDDRRPTIANHIDRVLSDRARLAAEVERLRTQLTACGVVAMCNSRETAPQARDMHPDYRSDACDCVAGAVDREMAQRERAEKAEAALAAANERAEKAVAEACSNAYKRSGHAIGVRTAVEYVRKYVREALRPTPAQEPRIFNNEGDRIGDEANMGAAQEPCEHDWLQASGGGIVFCTKCHSTRAAQEPKR